MMIHQNNDKTMNNTKMGTMFFMARFLSVGKKTTGIEPVTPLASALPSELRLSSPYYSHFIELRKKRKHATIMEESH